MSALPWLLYLLAPPKPRVMTWPLDKLSARGQPVDFATARPSSTTASTACPLAEAPRRQTCTVITADGAELWEYS